MNYFHLGTLLVMEFVISLFPLLLAFFFLNLSSVPFIRENNRKKEKRRMGVDQKFIRSIV